MTLVVTVATHNFVAQASDRRFTKASGELFRDDANKAVVLECQDGILSLGYSGLGFIGDIQSDGLPELRTDDWLLDVLSRNGAAEMRADEAVTLLAEEATRELASFGGQVTDPRLSIVAAGWPKARGLSTPVTWLISNCEQFDVSKSSFRRSHSSARPWPEFTVHTTWPKRDRRQEFWHLMVVGRDTAVKHPKKQFQRLKNFILGNSDPEIVTRKLVAFIRRCAHHPAEGTYIGRNCMAVFLSDEYRGWYYYDNDNSQGRVFAPSLVGQGGAAKNIVWGTGPGLSFEEIDDLEAHKRRPESSA